MANKYDHICRLHAFDNQTLNLYCEIKYLYVIMFIYTLGKKLGNTLIKFQVFFSKENIMFNFLCDKNELLLIL